jgi:MEMO1 family protein
MTDAEPASLRAPAVAGRFYPGEPGALRRAVAELLGPAVTAAPARAIMGPHAGYVYSGAIAGETWARVEVPRRVVLMCPNHTGRGVPISLWPGGGWRLPTGVVPVDEALGEAILAHCGATLDRAAHLHEHALEVHLPFALARQPALRIAALCLAGLSLPECRAVGEGLAEVVRHSDEPVLLVASTDMSHYIAADEAAVLDGLALARIEALDPEGLYHTVRSHHISMCGVRPTTVALFAARSLGATRAELVRYGHSGERSGDDARVVGYAGVVVR